MTNQNELLIDYEFYLGLGNNSKLTLIVLTSNNTYIYTHKHISTHTYKYYGDDCIVWFYFDVLTRMC